MLYVVRLFMGIYIFWRRIEGKLCNSCVLTTSIYSHCKFTEEGVGCLFNQIKFNEVLIEILKSWTSFSFRIALLIADECDCFQCRRLSWSVGSTAEVSRLVVTSRVCSFRKPFAYLLHKRDLYWSGSAATSFKPPLSKNQILQLRSTEFNIPWNLAPRHPILSRALLVLSKWAYLWNTPQWLVENSLYFATPVNKTI